VLFRRERGTALPGAPPGRKLRQVTTLATVDSVQDTLTTYTARNVDSLGSLTLTISNPPTQAQVQALVNAYNSLLLALKH
jgi:hypothetical protein